MTDAQTGGKEQREATAVEEALKAEVKEETPSTNCDFEEGKDAYRPGGFHTVYMGDVYNNRYQILRKIGYGQYSTVWLVTQQSGSKHQYRALKVLSADSYAEERPVSEREILKHLRDADKSHPGYKYICHLVDDFELRGPNGRHVCLVFELIGETLHSFRVWFKNQMLPNPVMRKFAIQLLMALDYAHDSGVIHTGATPPMNFDISLGDWGVSSWATKHLSELIQPLTLRSPEVLIGAPWDWTTDWWNLGAVILEVFRGVQMFTGMDSQNSLYVVKTHLEEIVDFFGPFPRSLLDQGASEIVREMFNEDGTIKDSEPLQRPGLLSDVYMDDLPQETPEDFVAFLYALMKIDPKERLLTMDLLGQPWIRGKLGVLKQQ